MNSVENKMPFVSLIIAFYKNIPFLELVLLSIEKQTYKNFEVIIAEDDDASETKLFLEEARKKFSFPIQHVFQEDNGFRKNKILNASIKISKGAYIQFIDCDSLLHKNYLKEFVKHSADRICLFGRRVLLDEKMTSSLLATRNLAKINLLNIFLSKSKKKLHGLYMPFVLWFQKNKVVLLGASMGLMKKDLLLVNGFDEDYVLVGTGEDIDLEWRLEAGGVQLKSLKYRARQYHLEHPRSERKDEDKKNSDILNAKKKIGKYFCVNGIVKPES